MKVLSSLVLSIFCCYSLNSCNKSSDASTNPNTPVVPNVLSIQTNTTASFIGQLRATFGGNVVADGGQAVTARGICWNTTTAPTIANFKIAAGAGIGAYSADLTGLTFATTYYVRAYATNSTGTAYGPEVSFTTKPISYPGAGVTDADGNTYPTIFLGDKEWMAQNLRTTKYQDGSSIPNVTVNATWANTTTGAWCYYNNSSGYNTSTGKLYNWYAATDPRKISPVGWHVPSEGEFNVLDGYLGGGTVGGGALKETGISNWLSPNTGATNISGFGALPGGRRSGQNGSFSNFGNNGYWWATDQTRCMDLEYTTGTQYILGYFTKEYGISIRCVKD